MPNELNIALKTGLTVTAQRYQAGAAVGSAISCPEVGTSGFYSGNMTGTAGTYQVAFLSAGANVGSGSIVWDGTAEVPVSTITTADIPSAASVASAVRTELTELSNLDATISSRLADADYTEPTSAPSASSVASAVRTELGTELGRIDQNISSRLAAADYTTPPTTAQISAAVEGSLLDENDGQAVLNAIVGAIGNSNVDEIALVAAIRSDLERNGGKLDSIPTDAAPSAASVATAVWSAATKEITGGTVDTLTNSPDVPTEAEIATQVRTELSVELGRIDQSISTRLAGSAYTAPANSDVAAIKAKTDNLPASPAAVSDIPTTAQIATSVEGSLLNEADGQAVLNAIVGAIGNTNLSEVALVAAIRADLERNGGKLINLDASISSRLAAADYSAPTSAPTAASVANAVWSAATRTTTGGTVDTLTNAPTSVTPADIWDYNSRTLTSASGPTAVQIRQEMDSNSTQLSAIKAKTDALPSDPADQSLLEAAIAGVTAPSAATVASAVRSELTAELAKVSALNTERLANVATTAIVGNLLAQANS